MQPQLGRLTGGAGGQSAYLHGGAVIAPPVSAPASSGIGSLIGGTLGGIGGGLLGGGSTFGLGAAPGAIAGAGAGSALGDTLEQLLTHSDHHIDLGNVGKEGALGLAGGTAGEGLRVLGTGLKAAGALNLTRGGLQAANALDKTAQAGSGLAGAAGPGLAGALSDVGATAAKTSAAGKAAATGNKLLASQYGAIPAPVARSVNLPATVGKLADMGITAPQDAERIANGITGGNGVLSNAVTSAVDGSKYTFDATKLKSLANNALIDSQVPASAAKPFTNMLDRQVQKISTDGTPGGVMDVVRNLEGKQAELLGKGGTYHLPTSSDKALAQVHGIVADSLKNGIYQSADMSKVLTPQLRDSLVALHPNVPAWQNYVDGTIMKSPDIGALRSAQAPFVNISKAINAADVNSATVGGKMTSSLSPKGILNAVANATIGSQPVKQAAAGVLRGSNGVINGAKTAIGAAAGTAIPQVAARGLTGDFAQGTPQPPASGAVPSAPGGDTTAANAPQAQDNSTFSPAALQAMAINDIHATGGKNLAKIAQLSSLFGANSPAAKAASTTNNLTSKQKDELTSSNTALAQLQAYNDQFQGLGGGQGVVAGPAALALGQLGIGKQNADLYALEKSRTDTAAAIASALANGGKGNQYTQKQILDSLPKAGDNAEVARAKISQVQSRIRQVMQAQATPVSQIISGL
jgi:hypothetical protein